MRGRILGVFVVALSLAACGRSSLQQIAEHGAEERNDGGVLIAVTRADGSRTVGVAGVDATGAPLTAGATWRIGSITKTFTAVVVLRLVDQDVLRLDDAVAAHLDDPVLPPGVTVRDLLQHTSGIPDYTPRYNEVARTCPDEAIDPFALIAGLAPSFAPGRGWEYSNTNYLVLGRLIEAVTGAPPAAAIREHVIEPLGLDDTYLEGSETGPPPVPAVADFYDTGPGPITCRTPVWKDATDGGMVSSAGDLDTFFRAVFDGRLVSPAGLSAMLATNEAGYGLGISRLLDPPVDGVEIYGNGGGVVGYKSIALYEVGSATTIIAMTPTGHLLGDQQRQAIEWAFPR